MAGLSPDPLSVLVSSGLREITRLRAQMSPETAGLADLPIRLFLEPMFKCMFKHIRFMTKTLTIKDDVYEKLIAVKDPGESFSDLFARLVEQGSSVEALKKMRGKITFVDKGEMLSEISARREEKRG